MVRMGSFRRNAIIACKGLSERGRGIYMPANRGIRLHRSFCCMCVDGVRGTISAIHTRLHAVHPSALPARWTHEMLQGGIALSDLLGGDRAGVNPSALGERSIARYHRVSRLP